MTLIPLLASRTETFLQVMARKKQDLEKYSNNPKASRVWIERQEEELAVIINYFNFLESYVKEVESERKQAFLKGFNKAKQKFTNNNYPQPDLSLNREQLRIASISYSNFVDNI
jgi:hypothetical protein